jgi:ABC-2 type transport system permease protein
VAAVVAWVAVGYCAVVALFAESFDLPDWSQLASPFAHTPQVPFESMTTLPLLVISSLVLALLASGAVGLRRRDVGY